MFPNNLFCQFKSDYSSSSCNIMFGIPSLIGNLRPVSGQTKLPSMTCTSNIIVYRAEIVASSNSSANSAGSSGKGSSQDAESCRAASNKVEYSSLGSNLTTRSRSTGDSSMTICVASILRGYPFCVLEGIDNEIDNKIPTTCHSEHQGHARPSLTLSHWIEDSCASKVSYLANDVSSS